MLVSELRELLNKYKEKELRLLIVEIYKAMPKKIREEKEIDKLLQDVNRYLSVGKAKKKQEQVDLDLLKPEIEEFIEYAYKQYYFAPNSYVHKKERPKWRFKVKAYIKSLESVPVDGEEGKTATDLMDKLYAMLSYACGYYIFNTEDPFRSVGINQTDLVDSIIQRKFGNGFSKESIRSAIELVINSRLDRETLHSYLINVLVKNLKTPDTKEIAIEQCYILRAEQLNPKSNKPKRSSSSDFYEYEKKKRLNNLVETVFRLNMALGEYDKAIKYFTQNYKEQNKEISLYVLLFLLYQYDLEEYWLSVYEDAVKKGIEPRKGLQKTYEYIKENDEMPEYFQS